MLPSVADERSTSSTAHASTVPVKVPPVRRAPRSPRTASVQPSAPQDKVRPWSGSTPLRPPVFPTRSGPVHVRVPVLGHPTATVVLAVPAQDCSVEQRTSTA